jgi:hypothetical protein
MYLDIDKAYELIDAAIQERGADYVYPGAGLGLCSYVDVEIAYSGEDRVDKCKKGCIVGTALIDALNLDMEELSRLSVNEGNAVRFLEFLKGRGSIDGYSEEAADFLTRVQINQDNRKTWGEAVEKAKAGLRWRPAHDSYTSDPLDFP